MTSHLSTGEDIFSKGLHHNNPQSIGSAPQEPIQYPPRQMALFLASIPAKAAVPELVTLLSREHQKQ